MHQTSIKFTSSNQHHLWERIECTTLATKLNKGDELHGIVEGGAQVNYHE